MQLTKSVSNKQNLRQFINLLQSCRCSRLSCVRKANFHEFHWIETAMEIRTRRDWSRKCSSCSVHRLEQSGVVRMCVSTRLDVLVYDG